MASSAFGDPAPLLERENLDAILSSDLELGALATEPASVHVERERSRVVTAMKRGAKAFVSAEALALLRPLGWDTRHFDVPSADLVRLYGFEPPLEHVLGHSARAQYGFLSARCLAKQVATANALESADFRLVDTSIEVGRALSGSEPAVDPRIRPATEEDIDQLVPISREFRANRFHLDPRISEDKATAVYESWVESAARKQHGQQLFVADDDGTPLGFCGYRPPEADDPMKVATLTLIVITEKARGTGLFVALAGAVEAQARNDGGRYLITSTQVHNVRALRAFARVGMQPYSARHVFHRWST